MTNPEQYQSDLTLSEELGLIPTEQLLLTGMRYEAMAWGSDSHELSNQHLDRAIEAFQQIIEQRVKGSKYPTRAELMANYHLMFMPLIGSLAVKNEMPDLYAVELVRNRHLVWLSSEAKHIIFQLATDRDELEVSHNQLISALGKKPDTGMVNLINSMRRQKLDTVSKTSAELAAVFNIQVAYALLEYWQTNIYHDVAMADSMTTSMTASPTFLNKPLNEIKTADEVESEGHITVLQEEEPVPKKVYGIYVLGGSEKMPEVLPNSDVSIVNLSEDLKIGKEKYVSPITILRELVAHDHVKLKQRVEKFLDVIDTRTVESLRRK